MGETKPRKKPVVKTIVLGVITVSLYAALLNYQDVINKYWALGGMFAFLPITTAFLFSFVHGSFTGNFWSSLGVEASKKVKEVK